MTETLLCTIIVNVISAADVAMLRALSEAMGTLTAKTKG